MVNWRSIHGDAFAGSRVLVTGGAGFIGSHLTTALMELGAKVSVIDDLSGGSWENLRPLGDRVIQVEASINDIKKLSRAAEGSDFIFHQAALGSVPASIEQPLEYYEA